ncbi:ADP-ribosylation factor (macronuclear) [Tetrahymena thermophila SB210]|uniref:ADP-ribosylation factor n=1 Tax=Tetrahymena thermophila (strain SB210) TaxID=312017 RepID=I7MGH8_TETTS|nr:ADP-ribosylation factor [Tetrahymena thermophila SB210]EAR85177.2 ADP-ribosylation factor [Tetrahymena thermophila SB210]|eukprot:XP_001032840.2 ADP-ribosylation factor [Tetrahymena thermophila SB210]
MAGQKGSGKTQIIKHLNLSSYSKDAMDMPYPLQKIQYNNLSINIWTLDGKWKTYYYCENYFQNNDAIIYVLHSIDCEAISQAKYTINKIIQQNQNSKTPVLIFFNQKHYQHVQIEQIEQLLNLQEISGIDQYHIQECCAIKGDGVIQGFQWLQKLLIKNENQ